MADTWLSKIEELVEEIRRSLEAAPAAVMEAEATELAGDGYGERSGGRSARRNGYRQRIFQTGLGTSVLEIPRLRQGGCLPSFPKTHQRSDDTLVMAVAECCPRRGLDPEWGGSPSGAWAREPVQEHCVQDCGAVGPTGEGLSGAAAR